MNEHRAKFPANRLMQRQVYFVGCRDLIKIGCSIDPHKRMMDLQKWVPYQLSFLASLPGNVRMENAIHSMFSDEWSHSEWFLLLEKTFGFIAEVAAGNITDIPDMPTSKYKLQTQVKINLTRQSNKINRLAEALTGIEKEMES